MEFHSWAVSRDPRDTRQCLVDAAMGTHWPEVDGPRHGPVDCALPRSSLTGNEFHDRRVVLESRRCSCSCRGKFAALAVGSSADAFGLRVGAGVGDRQPHSYASGRSDRVPNCLRLKAGSGSASTETPVRRAHSIPFVFVHHRQQGLAAEIAAQVSTSRISTPLDFSCSFSPAGRCPSSLPVPARPTCPELSVRCHAANHPASTCTGWHFLPPQ